MNERPCTIIHQDDHLRLTVFHQSYDAADHELEQFDGLDAHGNKRWVRVLEYAPRRGSEAGKLHLMHTQHLLAHFALALAEKCGWTRATGEKGLITWTPTVFPTT
jgi:hypothetical protein